MALPHLFIGIKRRAAANLFFTLAALSVAGMACGELAIMHSRTLAEVVVPYNGPTFPYSFSSSRLLGLSVPIWERGGSGSASQRV